ncbi:hypothetical protein KL941_000011 [Ogataea angusta]|nr:hypothetical protein KL941_000011 [Ogataea angusta]
MQLHLATARYVWLIRLSLGRTGLHRVRKQREECWKTAEAAGVEGASEKACGSYTGPTSYSGVAVPSETSSQDGKNAKPGGGLNRRKKTAFPAKFGGQFLRGTNSLFSKQSLILAVRRACSAAQKKLFLTSKDKQRGQSQLFD